MVIPKLVVAEDYERVYQLLTIHKSKYSSVDIDLEHSRTIQFLDMDLENTIRYEELREYLLSDRVPDALLLVLDLGYVGDEILADQLKNDQLEYRDIPGNQIAGVHLAIAAIDNLHIKQLMIFFATTRDNRADAYALLEGRCKKVEKRNEDIKRKFTSCFGCSEFIPKDKSRKEALKFTENYLDDVIRQWNEWQSIDIIQDVSLETSGIQGSKDSQLDSAVEFRIRFEGRIEIRNALASCSPFKKYDLSTVSLYLDARKQGEQDFKKSRKEMILPWLKSFFYLFNTSDDMFLSNSIIDDFCKSWNKSIQGDTPSDRAYNFLTQVLRKISDTYGEYDLKGRGLDRKRRKQSIVMQSEDKEGLVLVADFCNKT